MGNRNRNRNRFYSISEGNDQKLGEYYKDGNIYIHI
jgi:hypothetical protein